MNRGHVATWLLYVGAIAATAFYRDPELLAAFAPDGRAPDRPVAHVLPTVTGATSAGRREPTSMYRGDAGRGGVSRERVSPHLRVAWSAAPLNVGVHGASKASPAVDARGIVVGTDAGFVYAYDHAGNSIWSFYIPDSPRGVHATAALDADTVYVGAYNGVFYALDRANGGLRWAKKLGDAIGASAVLHEQNLYVSVETDHPDGFVVKLDARDGRLVWASEWLGEQSHSSPTLATAADAVLVGANGGRFWALSMATGRPLWSRTLVDAMKGTALVVDDVVLFSSWDKRTLALDAATGARRWSLDLGEKSQVSPTLLPRAGLVVVGDGSGHLRALRPRDGHVAWSHRADLAHYQASGLTTTSSDGREIFWALCRAQTLCAFRSSSGRILGATALAANFSGQPGAYAGALYLALDGLGGGLVKLVAR